ncbi:alcohol dehydrogenase catalytic domain-containing protein [Ligilactobacillus pobuzihii]|uniref:2,3-butanediol dehydrogenase n=1 Tax=Ligilactobacillus pobuzihii TaxID=449659 RepID=UPI0019CF5FFC|nr:2,3-butanediol dehydrogenase [Ligilactobacillus pobuzihii]MBN7274459.1 alcohol dehydrogenase catalytic domain-containing protein [Ligilactobacillus pobuzihii]
MKAARIYGKQDIRIEDVDIPEPKENEVQVKVKFVGICGSDIHMYAEGLSLPYEKNPLTGKTVPIIEGHEFSGQVVKVGKNVHDVKVDDRIAIEPILACGHCRNCLKGMYNYCLHAVGPDGSGNFIGVSGDGGMAEYANVEAKFAHKLPDEMGFDLGALVEPTAVAYEGIKRSGLIEGQTVAVMGAGPIGLCTAVLAKIAGATKVYISDVSEVRLEKAREIGIENTLNPTKDDVVEKIHADLPEGVDITFECAGVQQTFDTAAQITTATGLIQVDALFGKTIELDINNAIMQGHNIHTTLGYENCFPTVINIINSNQETFQKMITKKISLDDTVEGIKSLQEDKSQVKVMISPEL